MGTTTSTQTSAKSRGRRGPARLEVKRTFTRDGVHPYDEITWEPRDVVQTNWKTHEVIFEQRGVEFPDFWSLNASTIVTTKYFRGAVGAPDREGSLKDLIDRVVGVYVAAAVEHGYMDKASAKIFGEELTWLLVNQYFSFNSPVWFNVGTASPQQVSACFILSVDDSMDSILNWYKEEGFIFKGGSGAGLNLSRIRSSKELLSSGGTASGPVSFMRGADASAGTIKSGGATRRAAKMVVLDVDHPDIVEFVETKAREEDKIRALRDAGFDMDLGGRDITSVQYQNANNSVRVSDEFMRAVENGDSFGLTSRSTGEVIERIDARELFNKIAQAAWECADPGLQYDDTINAWHTNPETGRITASNPCSEYMSLDNSACNLASLNLMKFLKDGTFDTDTFVKAVELIITAMEISIAFGDFPTESIAQTTRDYRQLGIGYANLGALLMAMGLAYDSAQGRTVAAAITATLTGASYRRSAELAGIVGPYAGYARNAEAHLGVVDKHLAATLSLHAVATTGAGEFIAPDVATREAAAADIATRAVAEWTEALFLGGIQGYRNAQASVLAPTGTIGFMMDCDTTGIEPDFSLVKFKKLVGGGSLRIVNQTVQAGLSTLGYSPEQVEEIVAYIAEHGHVVDAPHLAVEHYAVFDCAAAQLRSIEPMGHVLMMAAAQPFLSGAISKTVNLPSTATQQDIADIYLASWKLGLKATAVYRDNCKVGQPLSDAKTSEDSQSVKSVESAPAAVVEVHVPRREKLPRSRASRTTSFTVGGAEGYMTAGTYEDGRPGEVFLKLGKQGSTLAGVMDAFSIAISIGLQYGVPLEAYVAKMVNQRFEPAGLSDDPDVRMPQSIIDYIFRRLALDHLPTEVREVYGIYTSAERTAAANSNYGAAEETAAPRQDEIAAAPQPAPVSPVPAVPSADILAARAKAATADAPECPVCFSRESMVRSGACWVCASDGTSTGCS